jgi:hypothetical protein
VINWLHPRLCLPPHRVTHPEKYEQLLEAFQSHGWDCGHPVLLGYPWDGKVQLVTGSHRWQAALDAGIDIPVDLRSYGYMRSIWGTERWVTLISTSTSTASLTDLKSCGDMRPI